MKSDKLDYKNDFNLPEIRLEEAPMEIKIVDNDKWFLESLKFGVSPDQFGIQAALKNFLIFKTHAQTAQKISASGG